jgi:Taurine catabolism dioxygenase TauD, TfdA family.
MVLPWFVPPPGYQFLHCFVYSATGGDSSAVDGFAVADYLRVGGAGIFDTLVDVHFVFRDMDYTPESVSSYYAPAISLT